MGITAKTCQEENISTVITLYQTLELTIKFNYLIFSGTMETWEILSLKMERPLLEVRIKTRT